MRFSCCLFLVLFLVAAPQSGWAAKDNAHQDKLKRVETTLQKEQNKQKKLQQDKAALEKRLERLRRNMIDITAKVQQQEKAILVLQKEQENTAQDMLVAKGELDEHRESLAVVITALQRMGRVPPEALLLRPSAPIDMARSFALLERIVPAVSAQAAEIKNILDQIVVLQQEQDAREQVLKTERNALQGKQNELAKMVKTRENLLATNDKQQEKSRQEVAALARQAKDLRDLMAKIETQQRQQRQQAKQNNVPSVHTSDLKTTGRNLVRSVTEWFTKSGTLPVTGEVVTGYGDKMPGGGISRGLRIKAAKGAVVTMPLDGVVRFAGPFRQYKLLVIVQHDNGDHSLLGGMQELYTKTGARVSAGEPLGKLPKLEGDSTQPSSLYYERRRNGKPIDPRRA